MKDKVFVHVFGTGKALSLITEFPRVPVPGEHLFLWLSDEQRASLGPDYGDGPATVGFVRDTALRAVQLGVEDYLADIFVEALPSSRWTEELAHYGSGSDIGRPPP